MLEFLPKDLRDGFDLARARKGRRSRLRVRLGDQDFPVVRLTRDLIVLDAAQVPRLRGYIEVFDGARPLLRGLIVAQGVEDGLLICSFKSVSRAHEAPPLDYERDETAPAGLLPRPI